MNNRCYTIVDNFNQEVGDFDVVVSSNNKLGCQVSELGIYWGTIVFTVSDFDRIDSAQTSVILKRNTLWNTGRLNNIINRAEVEAGMLQGTFKMKNIIKVDNINEEMMDFRVRIITLLDDGKIPNNVPRKLINDIINDAKYMGYM